MPPRHRLAFCLFACLAAASTRFAQTRVASPAAVAAAPAVTAVDTGPRSLLQAQVLLDRAHFSPGQIDGVAGSNQRRAVSGFQRAHAMPVTGELDDATWRALESNAAPALTSYTLTDADVAGPFAPIPAKPAEQAALPALGYSSVEEALGERFHADPALLRALNPATDFSRAGTRVQVPNVDVGASLPKAAKVLVDRTDSTLSLLDARGQVCAQYPASSGSAHAPPADWPMEDPRPGPQPEVPLQPRSVLGCRRQRPQSHAAAGPDNPVGPVWIDLSKPHYGIHGTP